MSGPAEAGRKRAASTGEQGPGRPAEAGRKRAESTEEQAPGRPAPGERRQEEGRRRSASEVAKSSYSAPRVAQPEQGWRTATATTPTLPKPIEDPRDKKRGSKGTHSYLVTPFFPHQNQNNLPPFTISIFVSFAPLTQ